MPAMMRGSIWGIMTVKAVKAVSSTNFTWSAMLVAAWAWARILAMVSAMICCAMARLWSGRAMLRAAMPSRGRKKRTSRLTVWGRRGPGSARRPGSATNLAMAVAAPGSTAPMMPG